MGVFLLVDEAIDDKLNAPEQKWIVRQERFDAVPRDIGKIPGNLFDFGVSAFTVPRAERQGDLHFPHAEVEKVRHNIPHSDAMLVVGPRVDRLDRHRVARLPEFPDCFRGLVVGAPPAGEWPEMIMDALLPVHADQNVEIPRAEKLDHLVGDNGAVCDDHEGRRGEPELGASHFDMIGRQADLRERQRRLSAEKFQAFQSAVRQVQGPVDRIAASLGEHDLL